MFFNGIISLRNAGLLMPWTRVVNVVVLHCFLPRSRFMLMGR